MRREVQGDLFATSAQANVETFRRFLSEAGNCRVDLTLTRNRVCMASLSFVNEGYVRLRLHEQFLSASRDVWEALARYCRTRRKKEWDVVAAYARSIDTSSEISAVRARRLNQKGEVYDLAEIARSINKQFFNGCIKYHIGWGRGRNERPTRRRRRGRSIRYGSWSRTTRTIRVHPLLDDERVPRRFVEYIVFHEMLHAVVPSDHSNGKRLDHPAAFQVLERAFPGLEEMQTLSRELLQTLV